VSEVADFLIRKELTSSDVPPRVRLSSEPILNITDLSEAKEGSLCWLSRRRFEENPEHASKFKGALLLGPPEAMGPAVVACADPKLAFALAAGFCFPASHTSEWAGLGTSDFGQPVISPSARIARGVFLGNGVFIGDEVVVGANSCLQHVTVGARSSIGANCSIGGPGFGLVWSGSKWVRFPHVGRVVIENDVEIGSNTCVDRGALGNTYLRSGARIDNLVHIAHNADIGSHALVIAHAMIAGSATIGERAWIAPSAAIMNQLTVGAGAVVGLGAVVVKSVEPGATVVGNPAKPIAPRIPREGQSS
jgi:UDP-3-O-[3-hydroxymyristoyl] glucosamine N-acyltransferase